ncbi:hypothetical protein JB92DRAFT_2693457 [Gautieria morchelliformis]|nr:hypothetical protein JB92DRAFT_2693457 [Gautieria morchelliformis]
MVVVSRRSSSIFRRSDPVNPEGGRGGNNGGASASAAASGTAAGAAAANGTAAAAAATATDAAAGAAAANASAAGAAAAGGNPQTSLTLDPSVIGANLAQDGQAASGSTAGQVASATSTNNFINSCIGKTITNGLQVQGGSCNPVPMGDIPAKTNQPSCKFQFPTNMANIAENTSFDIKMAIQGMETGSFVNPDTNYFAAPQALNGQGQIVGHSHFVVQSLPDIASTAPLDPTVFALFQGLNAAAQGGVLSATVAKGLPAGTYRIASINTASNHQPVLGPVAQHGSFDDAVYVSPSFTVPNIWENLMFPSIVHCR